MSRNKDDRSMPKLLAPIKSFEGAVKVIRAGADELYCDSPIPGMDFVLYRGPEACVSTYDELGEIVKYAHDNNVKVYITANLPFIIDSFENKMKKHLRSCLDAGVDAFIVGNLGLLSTIKSMNADIPLHASTYLTSMNHEAVNFLERLGFNRITLERQLTIKEISEIVLNTRAEIEILIHGGGCSNFNGGCYFHFAYPEKMATALMMTDGLNPPCRLHFDVYDLNNERINLGNFPILDAFEFCSLCKLPELMQTGVTGFKFAGRECPIAFQESSTRIYRELMDLIARGELGLFKEKLDSLKNGDFIALPPQIATLRELVCEQKRCFYFSHFHAPYKIPISWHAWTKFQLQKQVGVKH